MQPGDLLIGILRALPGHKLEGRKRLQKIVHLLQCGGVAVDADYEIRQYGPYSKALVDASNELILDGVIEERVEPIGIFGSFQSVYCLENDDQAVPDLEVTAVDLLADLNRYTTVELEVAATIAFYVKQGFPFSTAVSKTKAMKPKKTIPPIVAKSEDILKRVGVSIF